MMRFKISSALVKTENPITEVHYYENNRIKYAYKKIIASIGYGWYNNYNV